MRDFKGLNKQAIVVISVTALITAIGSGVVIGLVLRGNDAQILTPVQKADTITSEVQDLRLSGDAKKADARITTLLSDRSLSKEEKYALYIQQGSLFEDAGKFAEAAGAFERAAAVNDNSNVQELIGESWTRAGNKEKAISALKRAIALIPSTSPSAEDDIARLKQTIESLGGKI
jgi:tetratricopeptide (TPR) repeat protein